MVAKMHNKKAPGRDCIIAYWIKHMTSLHQNLKRLMREVMDGKLELPNWLIQCRTILLPKSTETEKAKNYRPIACLNITYKLYTGILNDFLEDHCRLNDIVAVEQAGGKRGSWGCTDQLLINKMILEEVTQYRRTAFFMWFDYKKAFDSIPHEWLFKALELAKVPKIIIESIRNLVSNWQTEISLQTEKEIFVTELINYIGGLLQGDSLVLLLFVLCINPLSFLLNKYCDGYHIGKP